MTMPAGEPEPPRQEFAQRFEQLVRRRVAHRGAFPFLALTTISLALGAAVVARLTAPKDFETYGDAAWWSIVTLATVGYGDIVPYTTWGRIIGTFVIVIGVTFLSFLTATVTSLFISSEENQRDIALQRREAEVRAMLTQIDERLAAIDARLSERT